MGIAGFSTLEWEQFKEAVFLPVFKVSWNLEEKTGDPVICIYLQAKRVGEKKNIFSLR